MHALTLLVYVRNEARRTKRKKREGRKREKEKVVEDELEGPLTQGRGEGLDSRSMKNSLAELNSSFY